MTTGQTGVEAGSGVGADPRHRDQALTATGRLAAFNRAGVLTAADVHVASRLSRLSRTDDEVAQLALAFAVRAVRAGSVCVDLAEIEQTAGPEGEGLDWPTYDELVAAADASPLAGTPPVLRRLGRLLYLDRYWREEAQVCADLLDRAGREQPTVDRAVLAAGLNRVFTRPGSEEQRAAAETAVRAWTTVLTGGPGTGKTTTVAALLALLAEQAEAAGHRLRVAVAAPTGKAAARLQEAIAREADDQLTEEDRARLTGIRSGTLHRLLGFRPGRSGRFRHHRLNRLPHDVVVVDETSMVSLTMMARLTEALRPDTRLILVGDPDQLASVEAGAVLADLVAGAEEAGAIRVAALHTSHRYGSAIGELADAVRAGDADRVLERLHADDGRVRWVPEADPAELQTLVLPAAGELVRAARAGDHRAALEALDRHRLLCAHRQGPFGVQQWNRQVERWLAEALDDPLWDRWYAGRPVMVTANDHGLGIYNGDSGVVVASDGARPRVWFGGLERSLPTSRLGEVETMHAMTIHKSQGSQADRVTVLLPEPESRLLTRQLLYTAVTRARIGVTLVGDEAAVRAAVHREAQRASGLRERLAGSV